MKKQILVKLQYFYTFGDKFECNQNWDVSKYVKNKFKRNHNTSIHLETNLNKIKMLLYILKQIRTKSTRIYTFWNKFKMHLYIFITKSYCFYMFQTKIEVIICNVETNTFTMIITTGDIFRRKNQNAHYKRAFQIFIYSISVVIKRDN